MSAGLCRGAQAVNLAQGKLDAEGTYVCVSVSDTGVGMDPSIASEVFRPYFTTKGRQGTGLGLATVAMQLRSVGGAIAVDTEPGTGTKMTLFWPVATPARADTQHTSSTAVDLSGATIIIVDDDANVSAVIASYLEAHGAEVACCEDPRDAITAVADDPAGWSALITDYDMPVMNGGALAAELRRIAPGLPIFVVTALAKRLTDPRLTEGQARGIFAKPVDLAALLQALAAAIPTR